MGGTLGTSDAMKWTPTEYNSLYGFRIAYSQGTVLVGQPGYNNGRVINGAYQDGTNYGAVYAYSLDELGNRIATQELYRSGGKPLDNFGTSVAIDGRLAVVGALWANEGAENAGSAWLFERNHQGWWREVAHLASSSPQYRGAFSSGVAVSGRTVAVGAPNEGTGGVTYIFTENEVHEWTEQARLEPPSTIPNIQFGTSVSVFGDTLVVGADRGPDSYPGDGHRGAAYIYKRSEAKVWNHVATLSPSGPFGSSFGASVSLWKDTLAVGATHGGQYATNAGSVYVFRENGNGDWVQLASMTFGDQNDDFGSTVAIRDGVVLVGASSRNLNVPNRVSQGAAYLYRERPSGAWQQVAEFVSLQDAFSFDLFGESVALGEGFVIIGAPRKKVPAATPRSMGAVYVYDNPIPEPASYCYCLSIVLILFLRRPLTRHRPRR